MQDTFNLNQQMQLMIMSACDSSVCWQSMRTIGDRKEGRRADLKEEGPIMR